MGGTNKLECSFDLRTLLRDPMLPKEHGAWNALIICLLAGWLALGAWNPAAMAASLFWLSGFILRAPYSIYRQYQKADPLKARKALAFLMGMILVFLASGSAFYFWAPPADLRLVLLAGIPLGAVLILWAVWKRNFRFLGIEMIGFSGVTLIVPVLYLTSPSSDPLKGLWLYGIFGGYFILALFYIRLRQSWVGAIRQREYLTLQRRISDGWWVLLLFCLAAELIGDGLGPLQAAPFLYAAARTFLGVFWGRGNLPIMQLGLREMAHSAVFTAIWFWTFFGNSRG